MKKKLSLVLLFGLLLTGCGNASLTTYQQQVDESQYSDSLTTFEKLAEQDQVTAVEYYLDTTSNIAMERYLEGQNISEVETLIAEIASAIPGTTASDQQLFIDDKLVKIELIDSLTELLSAAETQENSTKFSEALEAYNTLVTTAEDSKTLLGENTKVQEIIEQATEGIKRLEEKLATQTPPVEIVSISFPRDILNSQTLNVQFKNTTDKVIKEILFDAVVYDGNGYPVKVQFGYDNYYAAKFDRTLQPSEVSADSHAWSLYAEGNEITQAKVFVREVSFYEGETWANPLARSQTVTASEMKY